MIAEKQIPPELKVRLWELIDQLDFQKIQSVMKFLNWNYSNNHDGNLHPPSIQELREVAFSNLKDLVILDNCEACESGGFRAEKWTDGSLHIRFSIGHADEEFDEL